MEAARPWLHARSIAALLISLGHLAFIYHVVWLYLLSQKRDHVLEPPFYFIRPILVEDE